MRSNQYIETSLELHLFFGRIMKEHSLFLRAGFTPANPDFSAKAEFYLEEFQKLLSQAVALSSGLVRDEVLSSGELITEFTALAEEQTECLTGIPIDKSITAKTRQLICGGSQRCVDPELLQQVRRLNKVAIRLLDGLIQLKETILCKVLQGEMFTANYPLLIEHILREAKLYRKYLEQLERNGTLSNETMLEVESFWNRIMMEHAMFIRGLLDPCETELMNTADSFAKKFCALLEASRSAQDKTIAAVSLAETEKLRDFKAAGTQGIQQCKIRSIILPLLADHVLREANHYIRLLK